MGEKSGRWLIIAHAIRIRLPGFLSRLYHLKLERWESFLTSLSLSFLIYWKDSKASSIELLWRLNKQDVIHGDCLAYSVGSKYHILLWRKLFKATQMVGSHIPTSSSYSFIAFWPGQEMYMWKWVVLINTSSSNFKKGKVVGMRSRSRGQTSWKGKNYVVWVRWLGHKISFLKSHISIF